MIKLASIIVLVLLTSQVMAATYVNTAMAKVQVLNKLTSKTEVLSIPVGSSARFDNISLTVRACKKTIPSEESENAVFLEVLLYQVQQGENSKNVTDINKKIVNEKKIFSGWMFSSTPGLSTIENPQYDVWLILCQQ